MHNFGKYYYFDCNSQYSLPFYAQYVGQYCDRTGDLEIGNHSFHSKDLNYSRHYLMMVHVGTINALCVQIRH